MRALQFLTYILIVTLLINCKDQQIISDSTEFICEEYVLPESAFINESQGSTVFTKPITGVITRENGSSIFLKNVRDLLAGDAFELTKINNQNQSEWTITSGDTLYGYSGNSIINTIDGGYLVCGSYNIDCFVIKYDDDNEVEWRKTYSSQNWLFSNLQLFSVTQLEDESYILVGRSLNGNSIKNLLLLRIDKNGNELWTNIEDSSSIDFAFSVATSTTGDIIILSTKHFEGENTSELIATKINIEGNTIWRKIVESSANSTINHKLFINSEAEIIIGAEAITNSDSLDINIITLSGDGELESSHSYNGFSNLRSILQLNNSDILILGEGNQCDGNNLDRITILRVNKDGEKIWKKIFDGDYVMEANFLSRKNNENILIIGSYTKDATSANNNLILFEINKNGELQ